MNNLIIIGTTIGLTSFRVGQLSLESLQRLQVKTAPISVYVLCANIQRTHEKNSIILEGSMRIGRIPYNIL